MAEVTEDFESPEPPAAKLLWVFNCELIRGHSVTTMAWNKKNPVTQIHTHLITSQLLSILHSHYVFFYFRPSFPDTVK